MTTIGSVGVTPVSLHALGVDVTIDCADAGIRTLLTACYARLAGRSAPAHLRYAVVPAGGGRWRLERAGRPPLATADAGEVLFQLDQDLVIQLQTFRDDLLFVHAGVLEFDGRAFILVAESGGGKSTTTWALVHHGFRYLSDELAPVDLATLAVHPYPRALSLKDTPPHPYPLPGTALMTSRGFHVTSHALPGGVGDIPARLAAIFFLRQHSTRRRPAARRVSAAEAGARLYANTLNALAHPEDGLEAAIRVARDSACFQLSLGDLRATSGLVAALLAATRP